MEFRWDIWYWFGFFMDKKKPASLDAGFLNKLNHLELVTIT